MKRYYALVEKCSDASYWYSDKVGELFPILSWNETECYVQTFDSYNTGNYIQNEDWDLIMRSDDNGEA